MDRGSVISRRKRLDRGQGSGPTLVLTASPGLFIDARNHPSNAARTPRVVSEEPPSDAFTQRQDLLQGPPIPGWLTHGSSPVLPELERSTLPRERQEGACVSSSSSEPPNERPFPSIDRLEFR